MRKVLLAVLFSLSLPAVADDEKLIWKDAQGNPAPEIESQKAKDGFSGMLLVTPDKDWEEKWDTPPDHVPSYRITSEVKVGDTVTTLIFFANPLTDATGIALVSCDIRVIRPDGSYSIDVEGAECYRGPIEGDKHDIRMAIPVLGFIGEPTDQLGEYVTEVRLIDTVRKVDLILKTRFSLVEGET